jgi:hypothetical protein
MVDSEFVFEDGRKAEKIEIDQGKTKVTEIYVEPKPEKKLAQRITEKYCVCEREIETIDEVTGEVVSKIVEKVSDGSRVETSETSVKSPMQVLVEEKIMNNKPSLITIGLIVVVVAQVLGLAYLLFAS